MPDDPVPADVAAVIARKSVFVFDWDGTLFDSMAAKVGTFGRVVAAALSRHGRAVPVADVEALYVRHSGLPRAEIFAIAATDAGIAFSDTTIQAMSEDLYALNHDVLARAPLFDDGVRLLDAVLARGLSAFISSSVPQAELDHFVGLKLPPAIRRRLGGVFGSRSGFGKGPGHLSAVLKACACKPEDILVIGDDTADDRLSAAAGIDCIVIDRDRHSADKVRSAVYSLDTIEKCLIHRASVR